MAGRRLRALGGLLAVPVAGVAAFVGARLGSRRSRPAPAGSAEPAADEDAGGRRDRADGPDDGGPGAGEPRRQPPAVSPRQRTAAEWTTLVVSVAIVGALTGAALYEHLARTEPVGVHLSVRLEPERAERRGETYYVPFVVANTGREPAEAVGLVFEVRRDGELLEESTTEIPFLANSGSAEGELATTLNPAAHEIEARVGTLLRP